MKNLLVSDMTNNVARAKQYELIKAAKIDILVKWPEGTILPPKPEEAAPATTHP